MKIRLPRSATSLANGIFFIDCLSPDDLQTARNGYEEVVDELVAVSPETASQDKRSIRHFPCRDLLELKFALNEIDAACKGGVFPLIFVEGHGDKIKGIMLPSREFMSWQAFVECLGIITRSARGQLTVISSLCHSMAIESLLQIGKLLPFSFYYGYRSEVSAGDIEAEGRVIRRSLLRDGGESILSCKNLKISCYSEYDHVGRVVVPSILLGCYPEVLSVKAPNLSRRKIRSTISKDFARSGTPLSGIRKLINKAMSSERLLIELINSSMHDTERRWGYLNEVISHFRENAKQKEKSTPRGG